MEYFYEYGFESDPEHLIFYVIYMLVMGILGIASYVLRCIGVYAIANRRGIKRAWFSWVPVLDQYLLGCISDQYRYVVKDQNRNKRSILLWMNIGKGLIWMGFIGAYIWMIVNLVQSLVGSFSEDMLMQAMMSPLMTILGLSIPMLIISLVAMIFRYMALYDLYTSCTPQNSVIFLVLGILFRVTEPFFIFFVRNKDLGMPPRREAVYAEPVAEISAPEIDPWDRPDSE